MGIIFFISKEDEKFPITSRPETDKLSYIHRFQMIRFTLADKYETDDYPCCYILKKRIKITDESLLLSILTLPYHHIFGVGKKKIQKSNFNRYFEKTNI